MSTFTPKINYPRKVKTKPFPPKVNTRVKRLEAFVKLCRDGFYGEDETLMNAADRILKE